MAIDLLPPSPAGEISHDIVRTRINALINLANGLTTSTKFIDSEDDFLAEAPLNGSAQHVMQPDTAYVFGTSFTHDHPCLWDNTTSTECYGNGIGQTEITYTGTGPQHIVQNGSFRMRFMKFISTVGDGLLYSGSGKDSGTNISVDRGYIIANNGYGIKYTSPDFFYMSRSVIVASQPIVGNGGFNAGNWTMDGCFFRAYNPAPCVDLRGTKFASFDMYGCNFDGATGTNVIAGGGSNDNIGDVANFTNNVIGSGITLDTALTGGISIDDSKWNFLGNNKIEDSKTVASANITATTITAVNPTTYVPILGTYTLDTEVSARCSIANGYEILFQDTTKPVRSHLNLGITFRKTGGGQDNYLLRVEQSTDGGNNWTPINTPPKEYSLEAQDPTSITYITAVKFKGGDRFRVTTIGQGTTDDVTATSLNWTIGV